MNLIQKIKKLFSTKSPNPTPQLNYKQLCDWLYDDFLSYKEKYIDEHNNYYAIKDILKCRFYNLIHIQINHIYSGEPIARSYTASEIDIETAIKLFNSIMKST